MKGEVIRGGEAKGDFCLGRTLLYESYCSQDGNIATKTIDCKTEGMECGDGRCIIKGREPVCNDSDGGINYYGKGVATIGSDSTGEYCIPGSKTMLAESFCNGYGNIETKQYDCGSEGMTCSEGKCVGERDSDRDGIPDKVDLCPGTTTDAAAKKRLMAWRYADIDGDSVFETRKKPLGPIVHSEYNLAQTYGCTCSQILMKKPGMDWDDRILGCTASVMKAWISQKGWKRKD